AGALARRSPGDPHPPAGERLAAAVRVLHDLGPKDHPGFSAGPADLRRRRGRARALLHLLRANTARALSRARSACVRRLVHRPTAAGAPPSMGAGANSWRTGMMLRASLAALLVAITVALAAPAAQAFCGFYVAKADSKLYNKASKVVLAWDAGKTVITMASDYQGDPREFALVVPVPAFIERDQIGVVEPTLIDHLDAFTAPRLVEYFDNDPCSPPIEYMMAAPSSAAEDASTVRRRANSLGVNVEATYTVGEYDIAILSDREQDVLVTFRQITD